MGVHTFPKGICPKVKVIARLGYELAYYDSAVHRFNHYITRTPPRTFESPVDLRWHLTRKHFCIKEPCLFRFNLLIHRITLIKSICSDWVSKFSETSSSLNSTDNTFAIIGLTTFIVMNLIFPVPSTISELLGLV